MKATNLERAIHDVSAETGLNVQQVRDVWAEYWKLCKRCLDNLPVYESGLSEKEYERKIQGVKFHNIGTVRMLWGDYKRYQERIRNRKKYDKTKEDAAHVHGHSDNA